MTERKIEIPQTEVLRTAKALVLERALGWQRQLEGNQWQWRGTTLDDAAADTGWLTSWDELPDILGDLSLMHIVMQKVVIANVAKGAVVALIYNPREPNPWICRFSEANDKAEPVIKAQVASNNQVAAILLGICAYYGLNPLAHHRTYFPGRYLEVVGNARKNPSPGNGSAILLPPGARGPRDGG